MASGCSLCFTFTRSLGLCRLRVASSAGGALLSCLAPATRQLIELEDRSSAVPKEAANCWQPSARLSAEARSAVQCSAALSANLARWPAHSARRLKLQLVGDHGRHHHHHRQRCSPLAGLGYCFSLSEQGPQLAGSQSVKSCACFRCLFKSCSAAKIESSRMESMERRRQAARLCSGRASKSNHANEAPQLTLAFHAFY